MSLTDLFTPNKSLKDVETDVPLLGEGPRAGYGYTLETAWDTPSAMGTGAYNYLVDKMESAKPLSLSKLNEMYPDNPNLFTEGMTSRQAEYIYNRASKQSAMSYAKETRGTGFLGTLGYGIVEETAPISLAIGAVGGVLAAGPVASYVGSQIVASAIMGTTFEAVSEYAIRKGLEEYTKEEASITESVVGGLIGGVAGEGLSIVAKTGLRGLMDDLARTGKPAKYFRNLMNRSPVETKENIGRMLKEEVSSRSSNVINGAQSTVLRSVNDLSMHDRIRYKSYASGVDNPNIDKSGVFALFVKDSPASYNGPENGFGTGLYLSDNPNVIKGYASSVRQGGEVIKIYANDLKTFDGTIPLDKEGFKVLRETFKTYDIEIGKSGDVIESLSDIVNRVDDDAFEQAVQAKLMENGYDSLSISHKGKILDLEYDKKGIYLFKDIQEFRKTTIDILDGNKGAIPNETSMGTPITSKSYNLRYGEGILSNGKRIELDPDGHFATDPFYGSDQLAIGYAELWSKNQIDQVDSAVKSGNMSYVKKKYAQITQDTVDYLKQLEDYKLFDMGANKPDPDMQLMTNLLRTSPTELKAQLKELGVAPKDMDTHIEFIKKMADDEDMLTEIRAMQDSFVARGEGEAMGGKGKSVDTLAKEAKAEQVIEKSGFNKVTKDMVDKVTARIGTSREVQNGQIINNWKKTISEMKANNPEIAEQLIKAAFFCLRKNT
jgi:hypothetical protein